MSQTTAQQHLHLLQDILNGKDLETSLGSIVSFLKLMHSESLPAILLKVPDQDYLVRGASPDFALTPEELKVVIPVSKTGIPTSRAAYFKTDIHVEDLESDSSFEQFGDLYNRNNLKSCWVRVILGANGDLLGVLLMFFTYKNPDLQVYHESTSLVCKLTQVLLEKQNQELLLKESVQKMKENEERLSLALKTRHMGVWDYDILNDRLNWDQNMFEMMGISPENFHNTYSDFEKCVHPDDKNKVTRAVDLAFRDVINFDSNFRITKNGEVRHIGGAGICFHDPEGKPIRFTGLNWDRTDEVLHAVHLERQRAKVVSQSKMASLGEMAGGIAHEINNPLTIILNRANLLRFKVEKGSCSQKVIIEELLKIEKTVERISRIIKGLRALSRNAEHDPMSLVDLSAVIDDALSVCREKFLSRGIQFSVETESPLQIWCRPAQISQILLNLLNNAFDAIKDQGTPWIRVNAERIGSRLNLTVEDSGYGIAENIREKLMQPFFTTKEVGQGTGLGLSISKSLAEDHGGTLFYDQSSRHTRFVLELPIRLLEMTSTAETSPSSIFPGSSSASEILEEK